MTLLHWYGQGDKAVEIATGTTVCYSKSKPFVPLRWVNRHDIVKIPSALFDRLTETVSYAA